MIGRGIDTKLTKTSGNFDKKRIIPSAKCLGERSRSGTGAIVGRNAGMKISNDLRARCPGDRKSSGSSCPTAASLRPGSGCPTTPTRSPCRRSSNTCPTASATSPRRATRPCTAISPATAMPRCASTCAARGDSDGLMPDEYLRAGAGGRQGGHRLAGGAALVHRHGRDDRQSPGAASTRSRSPRSGRRR